MFSSKKGKSNNDAQQSPTNDGLVAYLMNPHEYADVDGGKTARLMTLVGEGIERWAHEFELDGIPKKIVFEQALDAMSAIQKSWNALEGSTGKK